MNYSEKLKDPRWQRKRLEILERDEWMCKKCFDSESTLVVHHLKYEQGKEPWECDGKYLITLCESCHDAEYETRPEYEKMILSLLKEKGFMADDLYRIVRGLLVFEMDYPSEVTASFLEFILSDDQTKRLNWELFWQDTSERAKKMREGKNGMV
jgi:hypothetical protein